MSFHENAEPESMEQVLEYIRQREPDRGEAMLTGWNDVRKHLGIVKGLKKDYGAEAALLDERAGHLTPGEVRQLEELHDRLRNLDEKEREYSEQLVQMERVQADYRSILAFRERLEKIASEDHDHQGAAGTETVCKAPSIWLRLRSWWYARLPSDNWPLDVREYIIRRELTPMIEAATTPQKKEALLMTLTRGALGLRADQITPRLRDELLGIAFRVLDGIPITRCTRCGATIYLHNATTVDEGVYCKDCIGSVARG